MSGPPENRFDAWGEEYHHRTDRCLHSLGGRDSLYYNRLKCQWLLAVARRFLGRLDDKNFLDLGCGTGVTEQHLMGNFRYGVGMDLSKVMLQPANVCLKGCGFLLGDNTQTPFADGAFDVVFSMTVLHHLSDEALDNMFRECLRVLKPGGICVHFDHNPYNYLSRMVAKYCDFDDETVILRSKGRVQRLTRQHGFRVVETGYIAFIPAAVSFLEPVEKYLKRLPLGGQYFVAATK